MYCCNSMFWKKYKKESIIYVDNAAGTPIDKHVLLKMQTYFSNKFFNASSIYKEGFNLREVLLNSRKTIANIIGVRYQEIIFCDGGTYANNLAIRGAVSLWSVKNPNKKPHIITSLIEHPSVLETCKDLEFKKIADVSYISVDENGLLNLKELKESIKDNTVLVSIGYVNGEIGVIQDIKQIAKLIRHYRKNNKSITPYFHCDAIQATNYLEINVDRLGVDLLVINASKIYGPKKIAVLYKKTGIDLDPIISGGNQESGLCSGTENIPYIVGMSESLKLANSLMITESKRLREIQKYFEKKLKEKLEIDFIINGELSSRIPNITNISIQNLSSEEIVLRLDAVGVKASVKSACKSDQEGDSHVILALRNKETQSIRFSTGRLTLIKDIDFVIENLVIIINNMRNTYNKYLKNG